MKKRIFGIAIVIAMLSSLVFGSAALAWGEEDAEITVSPVDIYLWGNGAVGTDVTISGSVIVTAEALSLGLFPYVTAEAFASYLITGPYAAVVTDNNSDYDSEWGIFWADTDAGVVFEWETTFEISEIGLWTVLHYGSAETYWQSGFWKWKETGGNEYYEDYTTEFWGRVHPGLQVNLNFGLDTAYNLGSGISGIDVDGIYDGVQYRFVIPFGTEVTRPTGEPVPQLYMSAVNPGVPSATFTAGTVGTDVLFSQPCTIYVAEGGKLYKNLVGEWAGEGEWIEVLSFTEIIDGVTQ